MNTEFTILGVKLEYDFSDADEVERLEKAMDDAKKTLEELGEEFRVKNIGGSASIRAMCKPYHELFANAFGQEASDAIFRGKNNYGECLQAIKELHAAEKRGSKDLLSFANEVNSGMHAANKPMNRKQRRAAMRAMNGGNNTVI